MKLLKVHVLRGDTTEEEIILKLEVQRNTETVTVAREVGQVNVVHILAVTVNLTFIFKLIFNRVYMKIYRLYVMLSNRPEGMDFYL